MWALPPPTRGHDNAARRGKGIHTRYLFARHYPRHCCSSSRIRGRDRRSGRGSPSRCPPPPLPRPHPPADDSPIPSRDLWIIVRLIPPARNENLSRKTKIRFDSMMYRRRRRTGDDATSRTDLPISQAMCSLASCLALLRGTESGRKGR